MKILNKLHCIFLHVARDTVKTKDGSALLPFLESKVEIKNASSKNCKIMENKKVWWMVWDMSGFL